MTDRQDLDQATIQRARDVDIVALVSGRVKLKRRGQAWWGCCPFHKEKSASFKVENVRRAFKCFGCGAGGDAIEWLQKTEGLSFPEAVKQLASVPIEPFVRQVWHPEPVEDGDAFKDALAIWDAAVPAKGTAAEAYLRARGIRLPVSDQIRFAPRLKHAPTRQHFRCMIARLSEDIGFRAVQRTYLAPGEARKADVDPCKMTKGPMQGGAVRLAPAKKMLGLAEGIETALSAAQIYAIPVWATLSAVRLGKIQIPRIVEELTIFADAGEVGIREAFAAQDFYEGRGLHVEVITPQADYPRIQAKDFNDVLQRISPA